MNMHSYNYYGGTRRETTFLDVMTEEEYIKYIKDLCHCIPGHYIPSGLPPVSFDIDPIL
jgi:hypothetical protein